MTQICMVAYAPYPSDTRIRREAEALVDRGDKVDVICLQEKGQKNIQTFNGVRFFPLPISRYRGSNALMYLLKYLFFFFAASLWLAYLHLRQRYQVVQIHTMPDFMVFVAVIPKMLGAKVVLDVHDLMPELYQSKFGLDKSHRLIRFITWIERRSVGFAHRAIAVHQPHLEALVRHGNPADKFIIVLNSPDPKMFLKQTASRSVNSHKFRLVYHGTLARRNGLSIALHALSNLRQKVDNIELKVFGEGDDIPHLLQLAKDLDLTDCFSVCEGWQPMEQILPTIINSDAGIVPILYDDFTKYMLPGKLLEYVSLEIPVICSRTETIEAYFDDSMIQFCKPGDADDLAEKILEVYRNPKKRESLKANAAKFNCNYSWQQQKQVYYQLIDNLTNQTGYAPAQTKILKQDNPSKGTSR